MKKIILFTLIQLMLVIGATTASAAETEWHTAVSENFDNGTILDYTVYDDTDKAAVCWKSSCPNNDATEWNVCGIEYMGVNYMGSYNGGIQANITKYIRKGDKLRLSFDYRSGYMGVRPFIEVKRADGSKIRYEMNEGANSEVWTAYNSGATDEINFNTGESVSIVIMNYTGFWHIKNLKLERFGEAGAPALSELLISGLHEGRLQQNSDIRIKGKLHEGANLYAGLYRDGLLDNINLIADKSFDMEIKTKNADELRLYVWDDKMQPLSEYVYADKDGKTNYFEEADTMKDAYRNNFLIGSIYNPKNLYGADKEILLKHFNVITAENLMKPMYISPYKGYYNWADADKMLNFAEENGLEVIGHTLVWHQQSSDWLTTGTADEVYNNMAAYINNVVGRYKGRIKGWDVVNEAIRDDISEKPSDWSSAIRKDDAETGSPWYRATKDPEYLYRAFLLAHEADPEAELYYNDYNLDFAYKREAAALLVKHINDRYKSEYNTDENLVDAIGMQSHYSLETNIDEVRASIARFREIGVKVNITELDVCLTRVADNGQGTTGGGTELTPDLEARQAKKYAELMNLYRFNADIIDRVTFWGYTDGASWRASQYPLMFNSDFTPKKAFYSIIRPDLYR